MQGTEAPLQPQQVLDVLLAVSSGDLAAENALRGWEQDAAPGFFHSLISIVEQQQGLAEVGSCLDWQPVTGVCLVQP